MNIVFAAINLYLDLEICIIYKFVYIGLLYKDENTFANLISGILYDIKVIL